MLPQSGVRPWAIVTAVSSAVPDQGWNSECNQFLTLRASCYHPCIPQAGKREYVESLGTEQSPFALRPPNMRFSSALAKFQGEGQRLQANEALRNAAEEGDAAAMRRAVEAGADIHAKDNHVRGSTVGAW